jgi:hypothetical protein
MRLLGCGFGISPQPSAIIEAQYINILYAGYFSTISE